MGKFVFEFIMAAIATACFGILLNIPKRAYLPAAIIGGLSWDFYVLVYFHLHWGLAISNLTAAIIISVLSMYAARRFKMPMIVFNVPALVSFVPGGQAYKVVRYFVLGDMHLASEFLYQVIVITGAITLGFGLGDIINEAITKRRPRRWKIGK